MSGREKIDSALRDNSVFKSKTDVSLWEERSVCDDYTVFAANMVVEQTVAREARQAWVLIWAA